MFCLLCRESQQAEVVCLLQSPTVRKFGWDTTTEWGFYKIYAKMLALFETPAGFALFKVLNEGKLDNAEVPISENSSHTDHGSGF